MVSGLRAQQEMWTDYNVLSSTWMCLDFHALRINAKSCKPHFHYLAIRLSIILKSSFDNHIGRFRISSQTRMMGDDLRPENYPVGCAKYEIKAFLAL